MEEAPSTGATITLTEKDTEFLKQLLVVLTKLVNEPRISQSTNEPHPENEPEQKRVKSPSDSFSKFSLDSGRNVSISSIIDTEDSESIAHEQYTQRLARISDLKRKHDLLVAEPTLVSISFRNIGGSRAIIEASRLVQEELQSLEGLVNDLHFRDSAPVYMQENLHTERLVLTLMEIKCRLRVTSSNLNELYDAMKKFHKFHGERLDELMSLATTLERSGREIELAYEELGTDEHVCKKFFDDILPDITRSMDEATKILRIIPEKVLPPIRGAEENATSKYLNMTTVATFFSAITATTLQFSFAETGTRLDNAVNLFWFLSLVFSISSAINSLLGMTWRKSAIAEPAYLLPRWVAVWLGAAPMVFLIIAAFTFITGLALFTYSSGQSISVASTCTTLVFLHALGLLFLTVWFLIILKQERLRVIEHKFPNGHVFRWATFQKVNHIKMMEYVQKNISKISVSRIIGSRGPRRSGLQDLEAGITIDEVADIVLDDMQSRRVDKGKAPERSAEVPERNNDSGKKETWIPDWVRAYAELQPEVLATKSDKQPSKRPKKAPDSSRFPDSNVLNNNGSFSPEDYAYALQYHMISEHPRREEGFPYMTTRLHAACPRPPSNASRYLTIVCSRCPVPPRVPLPHRGQPYPKLTEKADELLRGKDYCYTHFDSVAVSAR